VKFYPRRRRSAPAIIIISLIDVLIVMLVFMMVTTSFKNQPSIKIVLPDSSTALKQGASTEKPPVMVTIHPADPHFYLGARPVSEDSLAGELKALVAKDPSLNVLVRPDRDVTLQLTLRLFDLMSKAGVNLKNVKINAQKPGGG
jgi:biopolymer transport protein ExbD